MAIDFPNTPSTGQTFTVGDRTWSYDGTKWNTVSTGNSGVRVFANAASRETTIPAPTEGMYSYQQDSNDTTFYNGSAWESQFGKGRNAIINGGFDFWQRGTSSTTLGYATADRWWVNNGGGTTTIARESTIVPTGSQYAMKWTQAGSTTQVIGAQAIETSQAISLAGQTVAISIQFAASASTVMSIDLGYSTSTDVSPGGSWTSITALNTNSATITSTTYTKVTGIFAIPSTAKSLRVVINGQSVAVGTTVYMAQCQLEAGSVATPFSRAGGTLQGELAACRRYEHRTNATAANPYAVMGSGHAINTTTVPITIPFDVVMRVNPTSVAFTGLELTDGINAGIAVTSITIWLADTGMVSLNCNVASGLTQFRPYILRAANNANAYLDLPAEL